MSPAEHEANRIFDQAWIAYCRMPYVMLHQITSRYAYAALHRRHPVPCEPTYVRTYRYIVYM